jgi:hypothetical protein
MDSLLDMSLGMVNGRLLALRVRLFGSILEAIIRCPSCGETVELDVPADMVLSEVASDPTAEVVVEIDGYRLRLTRLTPAAMAKTMGCFSEEEIRHLLLDACLLEAICGDHDGALSSEQLPMAVQREAGTALAKADPNAVPSIDIGCGVCGHEWAASIDIGAFLWNDLDRWARRLLDEVHALALAYGWTEPDVLALAPRRRRHYLHLNYG